MGDPFLLRIVREAQNMGGVAVSVKRDARGRELKPRKETTQLERWIASAEGREALRKAVESAEQATGTLREARRVDPDTLREPVTLCWPRARRLTSSPTALTDYWLCWLSIRPVATKKPSGIGPTSSTSKGILAR